MTKKKTNEKEFVRRAAIAAEEARRQEAEQQAGAQMEQQDLPPVPFSNFETIAPSANLTLEDMQVDPFTGTLDFPTYPQRQQRPREQNVLGAQTFSRPAQQEEIPPQMAYTPRTAYAPTQTMPQTISSQIESVGRGLLQGASQTWQDVVNRGVQIAQEYGIHPAVLLGQMAIETGRGTSNFAKNRNNYFGYQAYDSNPDMAKRYTSPEESIRDYARLISTTPRYAQAYAVRNNPVQMIQEIKKAGYATDPNYVSKVMGTPEFRQYANPAPAKQILSAQTQAPSQSVRSAPKSVSIKTPTVVKTPTSSLQKVTQSIQKALTNLFQRK